MSRGFVGQGSEGANVHVPRVRGMRRIWHALGHRSEGMIIHVSRVCGAGFLKKKIDAKLYRNRCQNRSKMEAKTIQNRFKIDENEVWGRPGGVVERRSRSEWSQAVPPPNLLPALCDIFERKWRSEGAFWGRFPKRPENHTFNIKINIKSRKSRSGRSYEKKHEKSKKNGPENERF